jgi:hypothetical protein
MRLRPLASPLRAAQIEQHRPAVCNDDVGRLDIEMKYVARVHVREGTAEMYGDPQGVRHAQPAPGVHKAAERPSFKELHQDVRRASSAEQADDVGMRELGQDFGLGVGVGLARVELAGHRAPRAVVPHDVDRRVVAAGVDHAEHGQGVKDLAANAQPRRLLHCSLPVGASCAANSSW